MKNKKHLYIIASIIFIGILINTFFINNMKTMDMKRAEFISLKNEIIGEQLLNGDYRCCLEKPCTYCIEKTPGHGEGAICDCLSDIINGIHPCGECIGEILEGHGNPYLAEYFPAAIAEKTGELEAIKRIIAEKYETYDYK